MTTAPENWKEIAHTQRDMAVLISENQHLTRSVQDLVKSIQVIRDKVSYHQKMIEQMEKEALEEVQTRKTFWGVVKSEWYKVAMITTIVVGFLVTNFEIVSQVSGK